MQQYILGMDIGGTKIQVGLVSSQKKIISTNQFPMNRRNKTAAIHCIIRAVETMMRPNVKAIGVGITGHVQTATGVVTHSANLPRDWKNVPLKKMLEKKFKKPVTVDNDGHCIALAEATFGAGKKHSVVLGITLGTGIGSGLVVSKKIYHGAHNIIEIGHTIISDRRARCRCGGYGHFESFVSGPGIEQNYFRRTGRRRTAHQVEDEAKQGDVVAKKVFQETSDYLAKGLANILNSYDPDIVVLGGGLGKVEFLTKPAIKTLKQYLFYSGLKRTPIVSSTLKYSAGILGAALIAT